MEELKNIIRDIPDFPKKGIIFKDITPLLMDRVLFQKAIDLIVYRHLGKPIDKVVSIESRGFIFGAPIAYKLGAGFVPARKPGKLPYKTKKVEYELEYGTDSLEIHEDAIVKGDKILIIDDLLATGGTVSGVSKLVKDLGADIIECDFIIELTFLNGRQKLSSLPIYSIVQF